MVFESVVSNALNKFLGDYVENLNSSQLKVAVLGGEVSLSKLVLKQSALDDLNLPVKTVAGHIGHLALKIPWKNILSAPLYVTIKGLYLLAVPQQAIVYDEKKENDAIQEAKQRQLTRIELAKLKDATKDDLNQQENDSFAEKFAARVIQNLHLTIEDVHVRYEDKITNPSQPFAAGITLHKLSIESTDKDWLPVTIQEASRQFFKLVNLQCLSLYWISDTSSLLCELNSEQQLQQFYNGITSPERKPYEDSYVVGPITSQAKLSLNTKPELDGSNFSIPKMYLNVVMQEIAVGLSRQQYEDIIRLLHAIERMNLAIPYRKYRPDLPVIKQYARIWWRFAFSCVMVDIRRRRKNWQWIHMKEHRNMVRKYIEVYKQKLSGKKLTPDVQKNISELEERLDVFNITLARRQAEVQAERSRIEITREENKRGWFSGWFSSGSRSDVSPADRSGDAAKNLQMELTTEEKAKLYEAIGYEENSETANYPKYYVEKRLEFLLRKLIILLHDSKDKQQPVILLVNLSMVKATVEQRPAARAMKVTMKVGDFFVDGSPHSDETPRLVRTIDGQDNIGLLNVMYETNPLDNTCHQRIRLTARPLVAVYHAVTINKIIRMFQFKEASNLSQLQAAARQTLEDLKETSFIGLEYAIQQHAVIDVDVDIRGSYLLIPYEGLLTESRGVILCNMGSLVVRTMDLRKIDDVPSVHRLIRAGSTEEDILHEMMIRSYDKFSVELQEIQILSLLKNENWENVIQQTGAHRHLLKPMSIKLVIEKCLILDDPRLPKFKVSGNLPSLHLDIVDIRLVNLAVVLKSIPLLSSQVDMDGEESVPNEIGKVTYVDSDSRVLRRLEKAFGNETNKESILVQATELVLNFNVDGVRMILSREKSNIVEQLVEFSLENLAVGCTSKTFEMEVNLTLSGIAFNYKHSVQETIFTSKTEDDESSCLLSVRYFEVNERSPEFESRYRRVRKRLDVSICSLAASFHLEPLLNVIEILSLIGAQIEAKTVSNSISSGNQNTSGNTTTVSKPKLSGKKLEVEAKKRHAGDEDISFLLEAHFSCLKVNVISQKRRLAEITVRGIQLDVCLQNSKITLHTGLKEFLVVNPSSTTLYNVIATVEGDEALQLYVTLYEGGTDNEKYVDMEAVNIAIRLAAGRLKAVYLNSFVTDLVNFVNHFQTAKTAVIEASLAAANAAKQNVQQVYSQAARIKLDIELKAPYIIMPQTSKSVDALIIDLGYLTMKNEFQLRSIRNELGIPAVMDSIKVKLQDLTLCLAVMKGMKVDSLRHLLNPVVMDINIIRNLSMSWYNAEPDLMIDANLQSVHLALSQDAYIKVMRIALDNLAEENVGEELKSLEGNAALSKETRPPTVGSSNEDTLMSLESSSSSVDTMLRRYGPSRVLISFTATLNEIEMELSLADRVVEKTILQGNSLAKFALHNFTVSGQLNSDNSMTANVNLVSVILEDTRQVTSPTSTDKQKFNRPFSYVLYPTDISNQNFKEMLALNYSRSTKQDSRIDVHCYGFTLILCPSYLLRLLNFFTEGFKGEDQSMKATTAKPTPAIANVTTRERKQQPQALMVVNIKVDQPDIIIVEHTNSLDTNSLILNTEVEMTVLMHPDVMDLSGSVSKLHIFSCVFDPARRRGTKAEVLSPCTVSLRAKMSSESRSQIDVNIGDIILSVSPGTIELLVNISKSIGLDDQAVTNAEEPMPNWNDLWDIVPITMKRFPFLDKETDTASDIIALDVELAEDAINEDTDLREQMLVVLTQFTLMMQAGRGNRTSPLILIESGLTAEARNWSSTLDVRASLTLQAAYYNSALALWEPLLEPVDSSTNGKIKERPWELSLKLENKKLFQNGESPLYRTNIAIESEDNMELTVTRSFLDVASTLGEAFGAAVKQQLSSRELPSAHYVIRNDLDRNISLELADSDFVMADTANNAARVVLEPRTEIGLKILPNIRSRSVLQEQGSETERMLLIDIPDFKYRHSIPVSRSSLRYLPVGLKADHGENIGVVAEIRNEFGFRSVTLRGIVRIRNHLRQAIDVYYMTKGGNELAGIGRLEECQTINVPLDALYTPTGELFFIPLGYNVSIVPFVWRDLQRQQRASTKILQCNPRHTSDGDPFYLQVTGSVEHIYLEDTQKKTLFSLCYEVHLRPTVILHNLLPIPVHVLSCGTINEKCILPGESSHLTCVQPGVSSVVIKMKDYLDRQWACKEEIKPYPPELVVWSFESFDGVTKAVLDLGMYSIIKDHTLHMSLYCPFWMINNTGLTLTYKGEDDNIFFHPGNMAAPILFSFRPKSFFGKKKALVRVEDSDWSDRFSLDVAGNSGTVICKSSDITYQLGIHVQLSHAGFIKHVIFTPYYIIINMAPFDINVCETNPEGKTTGDWTCVSAGQSVPFWPRLAQKLLVFNVAQTKENTLPLSYEIPLPTLLRLDNEFGGIYVDFQITESSVVILCHQYKEGRAPVLLVNHCEMGINIQETNSSRRPWLFPAQHACYYTWENPNGSRRLTWSNGKKEASDDIHKDSSGSLCSDNGPTFYWISFLYGRQRILLFTTDSILIQKLMNGGQLQPITQNVTISLNGLGLSLVDNIHRCEILYAGITSSGVVWETAKPSKRYRPVSIRENALLENAHQLYTQLLTVDPNTNPRYVLDGGNLVVDFKEWKMLKPRERELRRCYQSGLVITYQSSSNRRQIHARLNKLQIDNQLPDCIFPIVFAPVPPPKSLANESIPHPFVEISIVELLGGDSDVQQYQYFMLLIQECHVRVDMSIVNALGGLFVSTSDQQSEADLKKNIENDLQITLQDLRQRCAALYGRAPENYFGMLHLSPLKIHLSYSNTETDGPYGSAQIGDNPFGHVVKVLIQSVGVSLTEIQDVVFRLAYFERNNVFLSWQALVRDLQWHYVAQAVSQFYVLVFGLDVIGNPYGLAMGITRGVGQLFYEPYQGAIQGPGEFVEGLALGTRSLIGHTVGGIAGAGSRISGTLGKGLAYLTFDEEYKKKRRESLLRRPTDIRENLAQEGKGLVMGFVEGVSGVVLRPIEGAQQEGAEGFIKGLGKGIVGLAARPIGGVADFISGSLSAVKKATDLTEEISRLRPPRFLHPDGVVRSYVRYYAEGDSLLKGLDKGRFAKTDNYVDHVISAGDSKSALLVTDQRLLFVSRHDLFGQWQVEWEYTWRELAGPPQSHPKGVFIPLRAQKKVLGIFSSSETGKIVPIHSQEKCEMIIQEVGKLMNE